MPPIRFELLRSDAAPIVYFPTPLPLNRQIWRQVEIVPLHLQDRPLARIGV